MSQHRWDGPAAQRRNILDFRYIRLILPPCGSGSKSRSSFYSLPSVSELFGSRFATLTMLIVLCIHASYSCAHDIQLFLEIASQANDVVNSALL
jgi:hypothetical protein